jgi:Family of unknown function (DUF5681)
MFENELEREPAQSIAEAPRAFANGGDGKCSAGEYRVGKWHPPIETRFRPGQSGNPKGRRRGRRNMKTIVEKTLDEPVSIEVGGKPRTVPMREAIVRAHAAKAAQGDVRSAGFVFDLLPKTGAFIGPEIEREATIVGQPALGRRPYSELFENVDLTLLSDDDKVELSRIAEIVELGGGMTALNDADFRRARELVNKGRGKDVTPRTECLKDI